jgi:hypothetical protein
MEMNTRRRIANVYPRQISTGGWQRQNEERAMTRHDFENRRLTGLINPGGRLQGNCAKKQNLDGVAAQGDEGPWLWLCRFSLVEPVPHAANVRLSFWSEEEGFRVKLSAFGH